MSEVKIPQGHNAVMPYLILNNAEGFLAFAQKVFGAKEIYKKLRDDSPTIMHAEINISGSAIMFGDCNDQWPPQNAGLFVYVADADATFAAALEAGAEEIMPVSNQGYGRSGGVKDPHGNTWWITSVV
ncbi:VOC family protein [Foetidibacter luteolus]|uniref:VOC family protein n=1 Tax=Foetidibacter luteolus TaxID=2608880 RepID=UPI00129B08AF|nr:VOC family protein [Foetidibacter luteolus]